MGDGAERDVLRLAARQAGLVRRDQVLERGLTVKQLEHRVATGRWRRLFPGVYRVEGAPASWRQSLRGVCLWGNRSAVVSHASAASLHGFARYREGPLEITALRDLRRPGVVVHRVDTLHRKDVTSVDGIWVTAPTRTLVDLASVDTAENVKAALDEALRRKLTTLDRLEAAVARSGPQRGVRTVRELVHRYRGGDGPTESELEARVLELLESVGLKPTCQRRTVAGRRARRLDFFLPGPRVVIEADGYASHATVSAFERERERNNALAARGFIVLHWTWSALFDRPDELLAQLGVVLRRAA